MSDESDKIDDVGHAFKEAGSNLAILNQNIGVSPEVRDQIWVYLIRLRAEIDGQLSWIELLNSRAA